MKQKSNLFKTLGIMLLFVLFATQANAQNITVTGTVSDNLGPVIGASIQVEGTSNGCITDIDGNYTLPNVPSNATLVFSYIGYQTQKIAVAGKTHINVTLSEDSQLLQEVVVVGYGVQRKSDLTGAVASVKTADALKSTPTGNVSDALQGRMAGVSVLSGSGDPSGDNTIRVRGINSITAETGPLVVIDGFIGGSLQSLNPADIASIEVLKDASATAVYGSRGANGVVLITTNQGKASKTKVSYEGYYGLQQLPKKLDVLNLRAYAEYQNLRAQVLGFGDREEFKDPSLLGEGTNWQDEIFRTAISTNHNVSIQGGLKNMPYRVSLGFEDNNGIVKTTWMKRFNTSVNVAPSFLDKHLNFNFTAKYMFEKDRYAKVGDAIGNALSMDPTQPVYGNGEDYKYVGGYFQYLQNKSDQISDPDWKKMAASQVTQNPVAVLDNYKCIAKSNDISGNLEVDYKIHGFEDLHLHAAIGAQYTDGKQNEDISKYSFSNNYFGYYGTDHQYKYSIEGKAFAEYAHKFGVHDIDIMAGAEQSHYHRTGYNYGSGIDEYLRDNNPQFVEADGKMNYIYSPTYQKNTMWKAHNSLVSYFGRFNYNLLDRYLLTATFRADGSSRFKKGKKWGYFPAAAFAWKINNEPFLKDAKWLDELKLRLGWGMTGQQNGIPDFYYTPVYTVSDTYAQYPFGDKYYITMRPSAYNPELTWEKTTTYNAGLDFTALNGRFGMNVDGYYRKTTDLLSTIAIAGGTNFGDQLLKNIGSLENYGVELAFDVKPIVTKDFVWDVTYNVGWNHNEITKLEAGLQDWTWTGSKVSRGNNTLVQVNKVGEPLNSFYVFQQVYDENGKPIEGLYVDRDGNGKIDNDDRYCYKSPAPDVIMGFTTKFIYKNWDFSAAFHASIGNYVYYDFLNSKAELMKINDTNLFRNTTAEAVNLGFKGTTDLTTNTSDYFVRNASYLKCSNMTLGYSFPALIKAGAEKICSGRIFFTVQNPFIITKYKGIDPEVSSGIDSNPYPRPISFQLGLNLNF